MKYNLLELHSLSLSLLIKKTPVKILDGVSFFIKEAEIVGIVGESGCGKSLTSQMIMALFPNNAYNISGQVLYRGENVLTFSKEQLSSYRGKKVAMVFQNPNTSLNPVFTIGSQMIDVIKLRRGLDLNSARKEAATWLEKVGLADADYVLKLYPHQLSGGMKQRVTIAMALSCHAELLIADEPTTALDVTIQHQILELLKELRERLGISIILITHNIGAAVQICDRIIVMYGGQVTESGETRRIIKNPGHPYTKGLIKSIPQNGIGIDELETIKGMVPHPMHFTKGCRFADRCDYAKELCYKVKPQPIPVSENHYVSCFLYG